MPEPASAPNALIPMFREPACALETRSSRVMDEKFQLMNEKSQLMNGKFRLMNRKFRLYYRSADRPMGSPAARSKNLLKIKPLGCGRL
jgi:hypothetical protein